MKPKNPSERRQRATPSSVRPVALAIAILLLATHCVSAADKKDSKADKKKKERPPFQWVNPLKGEVVNGLEHRTFKSPSMGIEVGYCIYLPPSYRESDGRFPVVYYLHGGRPGSELKSVKLTAFIDRAIRDEQIHPMIYVFVNGGPVSHYNYPQKPNAMGEDVFVKELIPHIDTTYRTIACKAGRGLEGFSQGGRGTMRIGLKHPHLFASLAAGGGGYETEKRISQNGGRESEHLMFAEGYNTWDHARSYAHRNADPVELMIFVGDEGFNYENNLDYMNYLRELKIPFKKLVVGGAPHSAKIIYERRGIEIMEFHSRNLQHQLVTAENPAQP